MCNVCVTAFCNRYTYPNLPRIFKHGLSQWDLLRWRSDWLTTQLSGADEEVLETQLFWTWRSHVTECKQHRALEQCFEEQRTNRNAIEEATEALTLKETEFAAQVSALRAECDAALRAARRVWRVLHRGRRHQRRVRVDPDGDGARPRQEGRARAGEAPTDHRKLGRQRLRGEAGLFAAQTRGGDAEAVMISQCISRRSDNNFASRRGTSP